MTYEAAAARQFDLARVIIDRGNNAILTGGDAIGDGGNSGFQALNLAINWGAKRILLVGFDMSLANGEHWHGRHGQGLNNPRDATVRKWLSADWTVPAGIDVVNCNPESALNAYRPACLMAIVPGSVSADAGLNGWGSVAFQAIEARL